MYANIVIAGYNSLYPGIAKRIKKEMSFLAPPTMKINVIDHPNGKFLAWFGGSKLARSPYFSEMWISIQDYKKNGLNLLR